MKKFLFLVTAAILNGGQGCQTQFWKRPTQGPSLQVWFNLVQPFQRRRFKCDLFQIMPNLNNQYKSAERKISQKNQEYMINYSLPFSCSYNLSSFWLILKQQWTIKISSPLFLFQNIPNLHNRYISADRKNSPQKKREYILNYPFPCSCS